MNKPLLIIYGDSEIDISIFGEAYVYKLSSLKIKSKFKFFELNNPLELDAIADDEKKSYIQWIYSIGNNIIYRKINKFINFNLFLFGDLSSMRNEIYHTYNALCNLRYLKKIINQYNPSSIELLNLPLEYEIMIKKNLFEKKCFLNNYYLIFKSISQKLFLFNKIILNIIYFIIKNIAYSLILVFVPYKNFRSKNKDLNLYLTRFPLHFKDSSKEEKYNFIFDNNNSKDVYLIDIISDGIHQNLNLLECIKSLRKLLKFKSKFILLDKYINFVDLISILLKIPLIFFSYLILTCKKYSYKGIDLSYLVHIEQFYSMSKNIRLLFMAPKIRRVTEEKSSKNIFYTIFEYPYGRLVSYFFNNSGFTNTIGMQHGPSSSRKLYHYSNINRKNSIYFPKKIICEDNYSFKIYSESNYKNISVMDDIPRLAYLSNFKGPVNKKYNLIFGGLHDTNSILIEIEEYIKSSDKKFIFKPHPRAKLNKFTKNLIKKLDNLEVTNDHLIKLFEQCNYVFCTYTSIGYEALLLDFDVKIIDLPGLVNLSQLADLAFLKGETISKKVDFISRKKVT